MSLILWGATKGSIAGVKAEGGHVQSPLGEKLIWHRVMAWRDKQEEASGWEQVITSKLER